MPTNISEDIPVEGGQGRRNDPGPIAAPVHDWINGGRAILDESDRLVEINEALRSWLAPHAADPTTSGNFWNILWTVQPSWKASVAAVLPKPDRFLRWELSAERNGSNAWFCLAVARHGGTSFVQLDSILPPLAELEEGASEELLENPSARRQLYVRLLRAEQQLNHLVRLWPGVIFSQRVDLSFQFISPKIEELTGVTVEEWRRLPQRFWQVIHEGDTDQLKLQLRQAAQNSQGVTTVYRIRHFKTGRVAYVLEHREAVRTLRGFLLGYEGVWLDVTRQTIAEKRLSTAAWKETLSVLTMGLAHDFSNIMAGIHSLSEAFQAQVGPEHPFQEGLGLIKRNSLQASQLIHRILHLHHGKLGERNYHNLNDLVREILELVRKIVPRHIRIETEFSPESLPVYGDAVEFRQVLINLALNAVDAMPQGGRLRFRVTRHEAYPALMHVEGTLPRLPSLCIATEDEGCGIPAPLLSKIFDPFFTTKALDKGSGLGLYNARLFAEKHHGALSVDSEEKKGSVIRIWLPEADFTEGERSETETVVQRRTLLVFGRTRGTLESTAEFLRESGFSVVTAPDLEKAIELLDGSEYSLAGVLVQASGGDPAYSALAARVRRSGLPIKMIVQIAGCNQDEVNSELLATADLTLSADLPRSDILARIHSIFSKNQ